MAGKRSKSARLRDTMLDRDAFFGKGKNADTDM